MSERKFSKAFCRELTRGRALRAFPIENKIARGMPDMIVIAANLEPVWIELKVNTRGLNIYQMAWRKNNPDEKVLLVTQIYKEFAMHEWKRREREWMLLHEDNWPLSNWLGMMEAIATVMNRLPPGA